MLIISNLIIPPVILEDRGDVHFSSDYSVQIIANESSTYFDAHQFDASLYSLVGNEWNTPSHLTKTNLIHDGVWNVSIARSRYTTLSKIINVDQDYVITIVNRFFNGFFIKELESQIGSQNITAYLQVFSSATGELIQNHTIIHSSMVKNQAPLSAYQWQSWMFQTGIVVKDVLYLPFVTRDGIGSFDGSYQPDVELSNVIKLIDLNLLSGELHITELVTIGQDNATIVNQFRYDPKIRQTNQDYLEISFIVESVDGSNKTGEIINTKIWQYKTINYLLAERSVEGILTEFTLRCQTPCELKSSSDKFIQIRGAELNYIPTNLEITTYSLSGKNLSSFQLYLNSSMRYDKFLRIQDDIIMLAITLAERDNRKDLLYWHQEGFDGQFIVVREFNRGPGGSIVNIYRIDPENFHVTMINARFAPKYTLFYLLFRPSTHQLYKQDYLYAYALSSLIVAIPILILYLKYVKVSNNNSLDLYPKF